MGCTSAPARIWIDTRNAIFRRGVSGCLVDGGFDVAGESVGLVPPPALDGVDVLLLDVDLLPRLPDVSSTSLVAFVPEVDGALVPALLEAGVSGFLVRSELLPAELHRCLDTVVGGGRWYPLPRGFRPSGTRRLTQREVAVLRLLAEGSRTMEIASALSYSERMVKNIVHDLMTKMECRTRAQAVAVVVREHVI